MNFSMKQLGQRVVVAAVLAVVVGGVGLGGLGGVVGCASSSGGAGSSGIQAEQTTFATADEAVTTFIAAVRANDQAALARIMGPEGKEVLDSGDPVANAAGRERFLKAFDEKHALVPLADGKTMTLVIGEDWPMPIPVVKGADGRWFFDTLEGRDEVLNRRVGRNELTVIQVIKAVGDAQLEYARMDPDGDGKTEYAKYFISEGGKKDGLFWRAKDGEAKSPLGELAAEAEAEGYTARPQHDDPRPYHGYLFKIVTKQGPSAPGGARDFVIKGELIGGFAVIAWPAEYGNSGVMTFMSGVDGEVWQKDLGEKTGKVARGMGSFDPGAGWEKVK